MRLAEVHSSSTMPMRALVMGKVLVRETFKIQRLK